MKTAIVYYSMSGNTELIANKIAQNLDDADLIRIDPVKAYPSTGAKKFIWGGKAAVMGNKPELRHYEFDADKYDLVIIGTPVWASTFAPPIRSFVEENREALTSKKIAVYTSASGGQDSYEKTLSKMHKFLDRDKFFASFGLTDPKDKPDENNDEIINSFCNEIKSL